MKWFQIDHAVRDKVSKWKGGKAEILSDFVTHSMIYLKPFHRKNIEGYHDIRVTGKQEEYIWRGSAIAGKCGGQKHCALLAMAPMYLIQHHILAS